MQIFSDMPVDWNGQDPVPALREALGYISRYRGETFVIKLESGLLEDPVFPSLARDVALLHRMGVRIVVVPGSRRQIDLVLKAYGVETRIVDETRITSEESLPLVNLAAFDVCNRLMTAFSESGLNALIGNWVKARAVGVLHGVDYQHTGVVQGLRTDTLRELLDREFIPILPNIGWSNNGRPYNVSSTQLAMEVAVQLGAAKLFFLCDEKPTSAEGLDLPSEVEVRENGLISRLSISQVQELLDRNPQALHQPQRDYFRRSLDACRRGVGRAHIVDGNREGALLREVFSRDGLGTMIYVSEHENIRRAEPADIPDMLRTMEPYVARGILVPRTAAIVQEKLEDYAVYDVDGFVQGCAALHPYSGNMAEIAAVAVAEGNRRGGVGRRLVQYQMQRAQQLGIGKLFLLTTQTSDWFADLGFVRGEVADLPDEKREAYNRERASLVYVRDLEL